MAALSKTGQPYPAWDKTCQPYPLTGNDTPALSKTRQPDPRAWSARGCPGHDMTALSRTSSDLDMTALSRPWTRTRQPYPDLVGVAVLDEVLCCALLLLHGRVDEVLHQQRQHRRQHAPAHKPG
eukprot:3366744-Rhodomonas_salina.4